MRPPGPAPGLQNGRESPHQDLAVELVPTRSMERLSDPLPLPVAAQ
jgi:hypothetical protein